MLVTAANLNLLRVGFSTLFMNGLGQHESQYDRIATVVNSTTGSQKYGWLGKMPNVREWVGPRVIQGISEHDYEIENKDFELTIGVNRNHIEDDNLGMYNPMFTEMGMSSGAHRDQMVFDLLAAGFTTLCYDGQNFFDTDHPVLNADGVAQSVSNFGGGTGTPWYLMSTRRAIKPIIFQNRKDFEFVAKDRLTDDNVFDLKEFRYGVDGRMNVGFGFWQMCYASRQPLTAANFSALRQSMMAQTGDYGRPLGIKPDLLVIDPSLESAAEEILMADRNAAGATNTQKGKVEMLVTPWLAAA